MRFPTAKINNLFKQVDQLSNIYVSGMDVSTNQIGTQLSIRPEGFWARITGVLSCSVSANPSSLTNTETACCTQVGQPTTPHIAYTFVEVQPDTCGRWRDTTRVGVAYEANDNDVSLNAIVFLRAGYADDFRFSIGGGIGGTSSGTDVPYRCVEIPYAFSCELDAYGHETGRTTIEYQTVAVLDVDCGSNTTSQTSGV